MHILDNHKSFCTFIPSIIRHTNTGSSAMFNHLICINDTVTFMEETTYTHNSSVTAEINNPKIS